MFTKKIIYAIIVLLATVSLTAQENDESSISFNLVYTPEMNLADDFGKSSIGMTWGLELHYDFNKRWGLGAGLGYRIVNVGIEEGYTKPEDAQHMDIMVSPFSLFFYPLPDEVPGLRLRAAYSFNLVREKSNYIQLDEYGAAEYGMGIEYAPKLFQKLNTGIGLFYSISHFDSDQVGDVHALKLRIMIGIRG